VRRLRGLEYGNGEKNLLDFVHRARTDRRLRSADLVGTGRNDSHLLRELVDCLPQRLVFFLILNTATAGPVDASSIGDAPKATDQGISGHILQ